MELAKKTCAGCAVQLQCLEYALRINDLHGIYGGLTPLERRAM